MTTALDRIGELAPAPFSAGTINNTTGTLTNVAGAIITPGQTVSASGTFAVVTMTVTANIGTFPLTLSNVIVGERELNQCKSG